MQMAFCFLIDEVIAVGDERFQKKCHEELFEKRRDRAFVIVSHDPALISRYCDKAAVLRSGRLEMFSGVQQALDFYRDVARLSQRGLAS